MFGLWVRWAALLLGLESLFLLGTSAIGAALPTAEQLAIASYTSNHNGGDYNIFRFDLTRNLSVNLTHSPLTDAHPAWSPDGSQIAFVSLRGGTFKNLYLMDADGRNLRRLSGHDDDVVG